MTARRTGDPAPLKMCHFPPGHEHAGWQILNAPEKTLVSFEAVNDPGYPCGKVKETITFYGANRALVYAITATNSRQRYYELTLLAEATESDVYSDGSTAGTTPGMLPAWAN